MTYDTNIAFLDTLKKCQLQPYLKTGLLSNNGAETLKALGSRTLSNKKDNWHTSYMQDQQCPLCKTNLDPLYELYRNIKQNAPCKQPHQIRLIPIQSNPNLNSNPNQIQNQSQTKSQTHTQTLTQS